MYYSAKDIEGESYSDRNRTVLNTTGNDKNKREGKGKEKEKSTLPDRPSMLPLLELLQGSASHERFEGFKPIHDYEMLVYTCSSIYMRAQASLTVIPCVIQPARTQLQDHLALPWTTLREGNALLENTIILEFTSL